MNYSVLNPFSLGANAIGSFSSFVMKFKDVVDLAVGIPQAALPWAGVCIGLQVRCISL